MIDDFAVFIETDKDNDDHAFMVVRRFQLDQIAPGFHRPMEQGVKDFSVGILDYDNDGIIDCQAIGCLGSKGKGIRPFGFLTSPNKEQAPEAANDS